jgi:hypothetical protein
MFLSYTKKLMRALARIMLTALPALCLMPAPVSAEGIEITPFVGYQVGGEFEDFTTGSTLKLSEESTIGIVFDKTMAKGSILEFFYSKQESSLRAADSGSPDPLFDVDVEYLHVGGKHYLSREDGTFLLGSLGATHFSPGTDGLSSETKLSLGLGIGIETSIDKRIGFRLESRAFATFMDSGGAIFCGGSSGGCTILISSDLFWQVQVNAGISFRF